MHLSIAFRTAIAILAASVLCEAQPDQTKVPVVPPPDVKEEVLDGIALLRVAFDREFDSPVMLATIPAGGGEQVVAMQRGEFCAVHLDDGVRWRPFLDFRKRMEGVLLFEEGVHGIAFHPRFHDNRRFYLSYSQNNPRRTVISEMCATKGESPVARSDTERVLMELPQPLADHWGGQLTFGPDGCLYIAFGDGGMRDDPYRLAQNPWVLHGKVLRIDVDARSGALEYGIPPDNPFVEAQTVRPEVFALGFRNPWGLSFDPVTNQLWLADVGQDFWEEINIVKKGANYGWSDRDGPDWSVFQPTPFRPDLTYTDPVHTYTRLRGEGFCIVGGFIYRGAGLPRLKGAYVFADWVYGTVWALEMDAESQHATRRLVLHRKPAKQTRFNPTLVAPDAKGEPIVLSQEGNLFRLHSGT